MALAIAALLSLSHGPPQSTFGADLDERIKARRDRGLPFNLSELNEWHGYKASGANSADAYIEVVDLFSKLASNEANPFFLLRSVELPRIGPFPTDLRRTINDFVRLNQEALKWLHEAALVKECRFPTDWRTGWNTFNKHTTGPLRGSQILNL